MGKRKDMGAVPLLYVQLASLLLALTGCLDFGERDECAEDLGCANEGELLQEQVAEACGEAGLGVSCREGRVVRGEICPEVGEEVWAW